MEEYFDTAEQLMIDDYPKPIQISKDDLMKCEAAFKLIAEGQYLRTGTPLYNWVQDNLDLFEAYHKYKSACVEQDEIQQLKENQ